MFTSLQYIPHCQSFNKNVYDKTPKKETSGGFILIMNICIEVVMILDTIQPPQKRNLYEKLRVHYTHKKAPIVRLNKC